MLATEPVIPAPFGMIGLQQYLPLANAIALIFIAIYQRVVATNANKVIAVTTDAATTVNATANKLEVVHTLVNNAASAQQAKVDALENELRELRGAFDKLTMSGQLQLQPGTSAPQQVKE